MTKKSSSRENANDRREYYRIEDAVLLKFQVIDQDSAIQHRIPSDFGLGVEYSLTQELQQIDAANKKLLDSISDISHALRQYLSVIDKKIALIATRCSNNIPPPGDGTPQNVSISEGGIAFQSKEPLDQDTCLVLKISFLSTQVTLVLFAKVIHCDPSPNQDNTTVATSFLGLTERDRLMISKHIMEVQLTSNKDNNIEQ